MSTETPPPFVPFAPNFQPPQPESPPLVPEQSNPETKKQKAAREKLEAKQAKVRLKMEANQKEPPTNQPSKPPRKRGQIAKPNKPLRKYDLQTILKIAGTLKEADQPVFEKLLGELAALAKGSRERVLKALGEVFC